LGKHEIKRLNRIFARYQNTEHPADELDAEEELTAQNTAFAYEHLRDFLVEHLDILKKGLKLEEGANAWDCSETLAFFGTNTLGASSEPPPSFRFAC
jgi:hypothetical protein